MEKPSRDDRQSLFAKGLNYAGLCFSLSHVGCQELEWDGRDAGTGWRDWSPHSFQTRHRSVQHRLPDGRHLLVNNLSFDCRWVLSRTTLSK